MAATGFSLSAAAEQLPARRVREWGRESLLETIGAVQREADAAEARKLVMITDWADLHRADASEDLAFQVAGLLPVQVFDACPVVMSGVPVDEFCLAELAAVLKSSAGACRALVEEALEVRERLPLLWARVIDPAAPGRVAAWKARLLARRTISLSDEAAAYVDRQVAPFAHSLSVGRLHRVVDAAVLRFDPDRAAAEAADAGEARGVWVDHEHGAGGDSETGRPDGTSRIEAVVSTPDALAFDAALSQVAGDLKVLGDGSSLQVRRSKAVGILADPQYAIDLDATADAEGGRGASAASLETTVRGLPNRAPSPFDTRRPIHIHLHTNTEVARVQATGLPHAASPVSEAAIQTWISELCAGARVTVTPVVDLNGHHAVDAYEAPTRVRAMVEQRDHGCVFPYCTRRAWFDLDHIDAYRDPDDGGPPAQTSTSNLAKLCRYHHRAKTFAGWSYTRISETHQLDGTWPDLNVGAGFEARSARTSTTIDTSAAAYRWTSPMGRHYLVDGTGTHPLL